MKKHKFRYVFIFAFAVVTGVMLMQTSQDVQRAEEQLAAIETKVSSEQESIRVLQAEWDYLNNPERLEALTKQYLDIEAPDAAQMIASPAALPDPFAPVIPSVKPASIATPSTAHPVATSVSFTPTVPPPAAPVSDQQEFNALLNHLNKGGAR